MVAVAGRHFSRPSADGIELTSPFDGMPSHDVVLLQRASGDDAARSVCNGLSLSKLLDGDLDESLQSFLSKQGLPFLSV